MCVHSHTTTNLVAAVHQRVGGERGELPVERPVHVGGGAFEELAGAADELMCVSFCCHGEWVCEVMERRVCFL